MVCVYKGKGPTDAHLVHHWLERNGLRAWVQNDLLGLRGEIPVLEAWPTVWVEDGDRERAEELIAQFHGPQLVHPAWVCPRCGEENEPNFGSCWNCSADRPGLPRGD